MLSIACCTRDHTGPSRVQEVFDALCAQDAKQGTQDTGERTRGLRKLLLTGKYAYKSRRAQRNIAFGSIDSYRQSLTHQGGLKNPVLHQCFSNEARISATISSVRCLSCHNACLGRCATFCKFISPRNVLLVTRLCELLSP